MEDNSHAGQGAVMLDIGGDVGALVLRMPRRLLGVEIEARPSDGSDAHSHGQGHGHGSHPHLPHVAVIERPVAGSARGVATAVFPELCEGRYEFYERPAGSVALTLDVAGGVVNECRWPGSTD
jgi:hypothetical protein